MIPLEFPSSFHQADTISLEGQRAFLRATRAQLFLLLVAGVASAATWRLERLDLTALIAGTAFSIAVLFRIRSLTKHPHQRWYEGRAAAESIKTLSWLYSVGGHPYSKALAEDEARRAFARDMTALTQDLASLQLNPEGQKPNPTMEGLRSKELAERKDAYLEQRIVDQQLWYSRKATWNHKRAQLWSRITIAVEAVGAVGAFLVGFRVIDLDLFGLAGAAAAVATAWLETKQHHALASAYRVAAAELEHVEELLQQGASEDEWARLVAESEDAISREHTLWRARSSIRSM